VRGGDKQILGMQEEKGGRLSLEVKKREKRRGSTLLIRGRKAISGGGSREGIFRDSLGFGEGGA